MNHLTLMDSGDYFALCKNCENITVMEFVKCHNCHKSIDKRNYKQHSNMIKYKTMIQALTKFEIDVLEDCHSMVSISIQGDKSYTPEIYQIYKKNNEYTYVHLEKETHNTLEEEIIDPKSFTPKLNPNHKYEISLVYGPNVIFVHQ